MGFGLHTGNLADNNQAIVAWETALRLDQAPLRDHNPDGLLQGFSVFTTNAVAGLAIAHPRRGEQSPNSTERQAALRQAHTYR